MLPASFIYRAHFRNIQPCINIYSCPKQTLVAVRSLYTKSYAKGSLEPPLSNATLPQFFSESILGKHSSRPALISPKEAAYPFGGPISKHSNGKPYLHWDFEDFDRHVRALSAGMLQMGVKKGERVAVIMGNSRCELLADD
jgi:hypothetical protein